MTGRPNWNYQEFEDGLSYLKWLGHEVTSPHNLDIANWFVNIMATWAEDTDHPSRPWQREFHDVTLTARFSREAAMRLDIAALLTVDAVSFLEGWEESEGARNEMAVAKMLGLPLYQHVPWLYFNELDPALHEHVRVTLPEMPPIRLIA